MKSTRKINLSSSEDEGYSKPVIVKKIVKKKITPIKVITSSDEEEVNKKNSSTEEEEKVKKNSSSEEEVTKKSTKKKISKKVISPSLEEEKVKKSTKKKTSKKNSSSEEDVTKKSTKKKTSKKNSPSSEGEVKATDKKKKPKAKLQFEDDEEDGEGAPSDIITYDMGDEINHNKPWRFKPMYKERINEKEMVWWVGFDTRTDELLMAHGQVGGVITVNRTKVELNKSGRSMDDQSLQEASQRRLEKYRSGYRTRDEEAPEITEAMLAAKWDPNKTRLTYPVGIEPKLDGVRCLSRIDKSGAVAMRSRNSVAWNEQSQSYFEKEIAALISLLPGKVELDGEMYGHGLKFETIVSYIKDPKKLAKHVDEISYNIFTYSDSNTPAEKRNANLKKAMKKYKEYGYNTNRIKLVKMKVAESKEEIFELHKEYLEAGYEGTMIYKFWNKGSDKDLKASLYKSRRSNNLLKYKVTIDGKDMLEDEAEIVGVYEGKGTQEGAIMFEVKNKHKIPETGKRSEINTFKVGLKGTVKARQKMMKDAESYIGKLITYSYQNLTAYGVPRFPVGKAIRDYE
jgi:hypothetical protein